MDFDFGFDFEIGKTYKVKPQDESFPELDYAGNETGKIEVITCDTMTLHVLGKPSDMPGFIQVFNVDKNKEHLYFVARTETAVLCHHDKGHGKAH